MSGKGRMMNVDLTDKIAVVTGAGRGLGRQVAVGLAAHGAKVALVARSAEQLAETARMIAQHGGLAQAIPADVSTLDGTAAVTQAVEERLGTVSILVNAAGVFGPIRLIKDSDPQRWIETLLINTTGPYLLCRAFVGGMIQRQWGRIVNVTSAAALHPPGRLNSAYATSKVALNQFTRHLAAELDGTGVTANVIHPGDVKTDMWAYIRDEAERMGPEAEAYRAWVRWVDETGGDPPQKAVDRVLRLMSEQAASITGQFLWIEDGLQPPIPSWEAPADPRPWQEG